MSSEFGLVVQRLGRIQDRVLVLGHLVGLRNENGWFTPGQIADTFEALRLPRPGNVSQELARLKDQGLVVRRRTGGSWDITPEGREAIRALVGGVDEEGAALEVSGDISAELAGTEHPLIPPEFAPVRFLPAVDRFLERFPFERNVFCMTRFASADPADPIGDITKTVRRTLAEHDLVMHLASDRSADDELFGNVAAHIWGSRYGIALLEVLGPASRPAQDRTLNDNVLIEVGAMLISGRRCGLLKDVNAPAPPTDFVAQIYREIDLTDLTAVADSVTRWVERDLLVN